MADNPEILFDRRGAAGLVTLNRPQALNAVTLDMVRALRRQLDEWRRDPSVTRVVLTAAGGRAFSAGGDIRALYEAGTSGRHAEMLDFYGEEYQLNTIIKHYPKPYVSLIDGIVMGGGVGLSVHGSHRVAGDRYSFAMPEVSIGFFPDVGATWFLPRLPGELGAYCALSGERVGAADAVAGGIATHRVASSRFADLADALCGAVSVDATLAAFAEPAGGGKLDASRRDRPAVPGRPRGGHPGRPRCRRLGVRHRGGQDIARQVADLAEACAGPGARRFHACHSRRAWRPNSA